MIDDDDKLRRNVVVFSAAVLAVTFLDLPIGSISAKLLGSEGSAVNAFRVWLIALLVLFYLVIRFSFPEKPSEVKPAEAWKRDFDNRCSAARESLVFAYFERRQKELATQEIQTYVHVDHRRVGAPPQPKSTIRPTSGTWRLDGIEPQQGKFWSGTLLYSFYSTNNIDMPEAHEVRDEFSVPKVRAVFAVLRAAFLSSVYSNTAANWLFPRTLAVLATLCISIKLVHTW